MEAVSFLPHALQYFERMPLIARQCLPSFSPRVQDEEKFTAAKKKSKRNKVTPESLPFSLSNHPLASPLATTSTQYRQWRVVAIKLPQSPLKDSALLRDNIPFNHDECFILPSGTDDRFPFSLYLLLQDSPSSKRDSLTGTI
jgi:hypothetical protein